MKEAMLYTKLESDKVRCRLCSHGCVIQDGKSGLCGVRVNRGGTLYSESYGKVITTHTDPIEKKPLFHYKPGSSSFSIATVGCNFRCIFCQNHNISQWVQENPGRDLPGDSILPGELARMAKNTGSATIAFTYTEPTIFAELAFDTAKEAEKLGIDSVFVTNGYMSRDMLETFGPLIKAANVDLKTFSDDNYRKAIAGRLEPVLDSIRWLNGNGAWLEITTLIIPGFNDNPEELREIAEFIAGVDPAIPWHISAFHPDYKMLDRHRTNIETLRKAWDIGQSAGLKFIYTGNIFGDERESTYCPQCGRRIIVRQGFYVHRIRIKDGKCSYCGEPIEGVY